MNRQYVIGGLIGAVAVTAIATVASYDILDSGEYSEVISVEPVIRTVSTPREECQDQWVSHKKPVKDPHQVTGTIAGAVIGGVLGNQVGGGKGKDIATVGGAVAGGYAGNKVQEKIQEGNRVDQLEKVCETVYDTHEIHDGYEVTYRYNERVGVIHMDHDPGRRLPMENGEPDTNS